MHSLGICPKVVGPPPLASPYLGLKYVGFISHFKGAIKSQNMFMSSYVTLISHFYDTYSLIQSLIIFSEFKFSFYSPGQPPLENHISGKEN